jgi:signal transduction histidine kinase
MIMFHKLRLRLMVVNLSVIFVLFSLLTIGTYFFVQDKMAEGRNHMMTRIARDLLTGIHPDVPPPGGPGPAAFFVKINSNQEIIAMSAFIPLPGDQLSQLVSQAYTRESWSAISLPNQREYIAYKSSLPDSDGMLLLFTDYQRDRETLQLLVTALGITGVICMLLSLLGSYFMANKAMKPIQKAWQQQRDFLADASHELRTPLAVIQTNLDVVRDAPAETVANQLRWLNNIHEEVQQMTGLVKSLLFLSQTDSQQQFLKKKMFALDQAMLAAAGAFRPVAAQKEINLIAQTSGGVLYHGDEGKLRQAISILLDNAIRHTPVNGEIKIGLEVIRQTVVLSVADSGEGIAAAEIGKIFLRFYQSDSSRSNGGAGLGLSIAKWIVESHGGVIKAASILGKGSTFTIRLPHTAHRAAGT